MPTRRVHGAVSEGGSAGAPAEVHVTSPARARASAARRPSASGVWRAYRRVTSVEECPRYRLTSLGLPSSAPAGSASADRLTGQRLGHDRAGDIDRDGEGDPLGPAARGGVDPDHPPRRCLLYTSPSPRD